MNVITICHETMYIFNLTTELNVTLFCDSYCHMNRFKGGLQLGDAFMQ